MTNGAQARLLELKVEVERLSRRVRVVESRLELVRQALVKHTEELNRLLGDD